MDKVIVTSGCVMCDTKRIEMDIYPARSGDLAIIFTYVLQVRKRIDFFMIELAHIVRDGERW